METQPLERAAMSSEPCVLSGGPSEPELNTFFHDYHVDSSSGDTTLTFDLPDGQKWRKRIWPRVAYPRRLLRWCTVEEIVSYLISFDQHGSWVSTDVPDRPPSGAVLFYDRFQTSSRRFQHDGYDWKMRPAGSHVRQDRMKLKVSGKQVIYGCYAHSASQPNFHRRSYWLIKNPRMVLVQYLTCESLPSQESEECCLTPSNFEMLAISDCNLCSLIAMVRKEGEVRALVDTLSKILLLKIKVARNISEAIEISNNGLPFDRFEEARTRKLRSRVVEEKMATTSDQTASSSGMELDGSESNTSLDALRNDRGMSTSPVTRKRVSATSNALPVVKGFGLDFDFLFQTLLSATCGNLMSERGPNRPIQSKGNAHISTEKDGRKSDAKDSGPALKNKTNKGTRGKEKALPSCTLPSLEPAFYARNTVSSNAPSSKDYDAEKFSDFTKFLVQMDPLDPMNHSIGTPGPTASCTTTCAARVDGTSTAGLGAAAAATAASERRLLPQTTQGSRAEVRSLEVTSPLPALEMPQERMDEGAGSDDSEMMSVSQYLSMELTNGVAPLTPGTSIVAPFRHEDNSTNTTSSSLTLSVSSTITNCTPPLHSASTSILPLESSTGDPLPLSSTGQPDPTNFNSLTIFPTSLNSVNLPQSTSGNGRSDSFSADMATEDHPFNCLETNDFLSGISFDLDPAALQDLLQSSHTQSTSLDVRTPQGMDSQNTSTVEQSSISEASPLSPFTHFMDSLAPADIDLGGLESDQHYPTTSQVLSMQQQLTHSSLSRDQDSGLSLHRPESDVSLSNNSEQNSAHRFSSASEISAENFLPDGGFSHNLFPSQTPSSCYSNDSHDLNTSSLSRIRSVSDPQNTGFAFSSNATTAAAAMHNPLPSASLSSFQSGQRHTLPRVVVVSSDGSSCTTTTTSSSSDVWQGGGDCGGRGGGGGGGLVMVDPIQLWLDSTYAAGTVDEQLASQAALMAEPPHMDLTFQPQHTPRDSLLPESEAASSHEVVQSKAIGAGALYSLSTQADGGLSSNSALDFFSLPPSDLFPVGAVTNERKISNVSSVSEPITYQPYHTQNTLEEVNRMLRMPPPLFVPGGPSSSSSSPDSRATRTEALKALHLSLPDLTFDSSSTTTATAAEKGYLPPQNMLTVQDSRSGHASPLTNSPSLSRLSLSPLQDIPEGIQMELENPLTFFPHLPLDPEQFPYRESSPIPSSPSVASLSSPSLFDPTESPSVIELCELIGESSKVQHGDFSHLTLTAAEKDQLFGAAQTIQSAFRHYKHKRKMKSQEKNAALLIENYYKRYKELKQQKDQAARRIQQQYRNYRSRSRELNRAAVFIQQMYRYHRMRTRSPDYDEDTPK